MRVVVAGGSVEFLRGERGSCVHRNNQKTVFAATHPVSFGTTAVRVVDGDHVGVEMDIVAWVCCEDVVCLRC